MTEFSPNADREPAPTGDGVRFDGRLLVLERLAADPHRPFNRLEARRALVDAGGSAVAAAATAHGDFQLLARAADQLGIRATTLKLSVAQALDVANQGTRLAAPWLQMDGDWLVVTNSGPKKLLVETVTQGADWITLAELARRLGVPDATTPVQWLASERPAAVAVSAGLDSHAHDEHHHGPSPLRRLIALLRPEVRDIIVVGIFSAVVGILSLATPLAVEALVNTISFGRLVQPLIVLCVILLGFLGFGAALKAVQQYVAELIQQRLFVRVVADLAYRLPRVDRRAFDDKHAPELLNRFFEVITVQKSAALLVLEGLAIVLKTFIGMAVLAFYHPLLLGFDLFLLAMMALIIFVLGRGAVATSIRESRAKYAVAAWLQELAHFLPTFKGDGGPRQALERADALTIEYLTARRGHFRILMRQVVFALGMQAVSGSILLGVGGWLVMQGQITLGQLVAAELIVAVIVDTFASLNKHAESFYDLLAAVDKIGHLLDLPLERLSGQSLTSRSRGMALRVHRAGYTFDDGAEGLRDANLEVAAGELVVIAATSGVESSVLVDLLFHLRQAGSGYVCADDADLRTLSPVAYRDQAALARQIELFTGTLAENVHLNRDGVDGNRVREVLQAVGLWDDVLQLPEGAGTQVVPGGGLLSDCQARRLMLARALAGRPRLLLIDRLLDALPDTTLPPVLEALGQLKDECTIVVVSGRQEIFEAGRVCRLDGPAQGPSWAERPAPIAAAMEAS